MLDNPVSNQGFSCRVRCWPISQETTKQMGFLLLLLVVVVVVVVMVVLLAFI